MAIVTSQDLLNEGLSASEYPSNWVNGRIALALEFLEEVTGRWFDKRTAQTFLLDGNDRSLIELPQAPVGDLTSVTIDDTLLDPTAYRLKKSNEFDWRRYPRLKRIDDNGIWTLGDENIEVVGDFGLVDSNGAPPRRIKQCLIRMAILWAPKAADSDTDRENRIISETIEDYSYTLESVATGGGSFGDQLIDGVIADYTKTSMGVA